MRARLGDWGEICLGLGERKIVFFFLGFLMFLEKNSQLNPGKKEISLFKIAWLFCLFFCETTSLQVRRELPSSLTGDVPADSFVKS